MASKFMLFGGFFCASYAVDDAAHCPIRSDTNVVYSLAEGVGDASKIWIEDFLWWWKETDNTLSYQSLTASQIQSCSLSSYQNVKVFLNPGGNTYDQLGSLGSSGRNNILNYINRGSGSAYVGFCAGGYLAAKDYYWETLHEDSAYFKKYGTAPPLGSFPYSVEGSITDIADDQFGDLQPSGVKYRVVNVSNGHKMLYYGGSTFGWNMAPDVSSDPNIEVLAYYQDFYGYLSYNLPAVWKYNNLLLTSVHPEADNCTKYDCPVAGTIPTENILQNRAWLATHINTVAGTDFIVPETSLAPSFDSSPPHSSYPVMSCYNGGTPKEAPILFCDDFDAAMGTVPSGLWNWQRADTTYNAPNPWNATYTSLFGAPAQGNGYAIASISSANNDWASMSTFPVATSYGSYLNFYWSGYGATFTVQYTTNAGYSWENLQVPGVSQQWTKQSLALPSAKALQVRFNCGGSGLCALDDVSITAPSVSAV